MNKLSLRTLVLFAVLSVVFVSSVGNIAVADSSSPLITPTDPEQSTTLPQRIASRKSALKLQLSSLQQQSLAKKCSVAQAALQDIKTKTSNSANNRSQTYTLLAKNLDTTIDHLERQSVDTTALKATQIKFNNAINQYLTDLLVYKTAMDDVVVMDCASDTPGFEATLLSARQQREQLAKDVAAIKTLVPEITKSLTDTKDVLIKKDNTGTNKDTSQ